jgi:hypothetical protein
MIDGDGTLSDGIGGGSFGVKNNQQISPCAVYASSPIQKGVASGELSDTDSGMTLKSKGQIPADPDYITMKHKKMWHLMDSYIGHDKESIQKQIVTHVEYTGAKSRFDLNLQTYALAVASSLKDRLVECFNDTS